MNNYNYDNKFIEKLNLPFIVKKYNLDNSNYNLAIYYALSSMKKHLMEVTTENLLFGDYYSFEYYDILKSDLEKLEMLTAVMKKGYISLVIGEKANKFFYNIINLLFSFYNKNLEKSDMENLMDTFNKLVINKNKKLMEL